MKMCLLLVPIAADSELARESPQLSSISLNLANIHQIGILVKGFIQRMPLILDIESALMNMVVYL